MSTMPPAFDYPQQFDDPVREDLAIGHRRAWERLSLPGTWWTGRECVAIATGIPLDAPLNVATESFRTELGIDRYGSAKNPQAVTIWQRAIWRLIEPIAHTALRRVGRRARSKADFHEEAKIFEFLQESVPEDVVADGGHSIAPIVSGWSEGSRQGRHSAHWPTLVRRRAASHFFSTAGKFWSDNQASGEAKFATLRALRRSIEIP